jgi:hypothetical protein
MLCIQYFTSVLIPSEPETVQIQKSRVGFISEKVILKYPDEDYEMAEWNNADHSTDASDLLLHKDNEPFLQPVHPHGSHSLSYDSHYPDHHIPLKDSPSPQSSVNFQFMSKHSDKDFPSQFHPQFHKPTIGILPDDSFDKEEEEATLVTVERSEPQSEAKLEAYSSSDKDVETSVEGGRTAEKGLAWSSSSYGSVMMQTSPELKIDSNPRKNHNRPLPSPIHTSTNIPFQMDINDARYSMAISSPSSMDSSPLAVGGARKSRSFFMDSINLSKFGFGSVDFHGPVNRASFRCPEIPTGAIDNPEDVNTNTVHGVNTSRKVYLKRLPYGFYQQEEMPTFFEQLCLGVGDFFTCRIFFPEAQRNNTEDIIARSISAAHHEQNTNRHLPDVNSMLVRSNSSGITVPPQTANNKRVYRQRLRYNDETVNLKLSSLDIMEYPTTEELERWKPPISKDVIEYDPEFDLFKLDI